MDDPKWLEFLDFISIDKKLTNTQKTTLKAKFPTFNGMANDRDLIKEFDLTDTGWKKRLGKLYEIFGFNGDGKDKAIPLQESLQHEYLNWLQKQEQEQESLVENLPSRITDPIQVTTPKPPIEWLDRSSQLLEAQKHLTTNRLLKESNRKIDDINIGLVERKERPKMKEVEDAAQGSQLYHPTEYIDTKRYEHEDFLAEVVGNRVAGKHIAIIGEPGAGKTTILTKIGAWLIKQAKQQPEAPLVVAWISLASLDKQELSDYFYTTWLKSAHPAARPPRSWEEELPQLVEQRRVWLLLDGLDELSQSNTPNWLNEQLSGWGQNLRVVMTCRINQWEAAAGGNILTNSFDVYRTLDYSYQTSQGEDQVEKFISNWFGDKDKEVANQIRRELDAPGKERIKDLVKNPLRLTLLCASWEQDRQALPETQADLYERFVDYLYAWKANLRKFKKTVKLRGELDLALGILAKMGLNRGSNHDGVVRRFRFTAREIRQLWKEQNLPDTLLSAAEKLGWLNVVEADLNPMYAFYHTTFQEYFAACSIDDDDWDYFLPKRHEDRPVPCQGESVPTYRVFEQEWRQVILFWIGRRAEDISDEIKEEFIKRLTDFQGQDRGFYHYRAYIMAAIVVGEFKSSKQAKLIVEQIIKYAFGYFILENNKWRNFLYSIESLARATISFTHRQYAIESLQNRLSQSNSSDYTRSDVESALYQITMSSKKIIEEDNWKSSDDLAFYVDPFDSEFEKQRIEKQRIEKAITSFNQNDYRNCSVDIKILSQAVGNEQAIKALIAFIGQYKYHGISTVRYGFNAAVALGKIAVGNKSAIKDLIDLLQDDNADYQMLYIAIRAIVTRSEMPLVIKNVKKYLTKESCESNFHRFNNCYIIVFQYAQSLTYPEFYKSWHQREDRASLKLEFSKDN
jgi:NACHT domain